MSDPGARFIARTRGRRYRSPIWKRWIQSPEWGEHLQDCTDPYCSMLDTPYGACGVRLPVKRAEHEIRARRRARLLYVSDNGQERFCGPLGIVKERK